MGKTWEFRREPHSDTEDLNYKTLPGQDGGVGKSTVLPRTTKRKNTNLKTKDNQNCQKLNCMEV